VGGQLTRVTRDALARPVLTVARDLLGAVVVHADRDGVVAVRLTEVEAYAGPADPASHAARGRTPRTAVMFGPAGHAYVYFSYGMHWCLNVVAGPHGEASAVLLRAGEVVEGLSLAVDRRPGATRRDLARGPARLTRALGVGREQDGADLCADDAALRLECGGPIAGDRVRSGPRVGVSVGTESPWRFWLAGEPTVSAWRPGRPRRTPG
jgi:DNA-3-methyladenine glycosylase